MWITRERIVPAAPRPAWLCYAGLGVALGAVMAPVVYYGAYALLHKAAEGSPRGDSPVPVALLILAIGIGLSPLYLLPVLYRVTQRWGAVLGFSVALIGTMWVVLEGAKVLTRADGGLRVSDWLTPDLLMVAGAEVGGYVVLAAALRMVYRMFIRASEHRPGACAWCGYTLGSEAITRCPECGRPMVPLRFRWHRFVTGVTRLAERGRFTGGCTVVLLIAVASVPLWTRTTPTLRFYARFSDYERVQGWKWSLSSSALSAGGNRYDTPAVWRMIPGRDGRGVYVMFSPGRSELRSRMNVGISGSNEKGLPVGSMRIAADLTDEQVAYVLSHGLPDGLVRALDQQADEVAWMPESAPRGQKSIDPTPYFPPK